MIGYEHWCGDESHHAPHGDCYGMQREDASPQGEVDGRVRVIDRIELLSASPDADGCLKPAFRVAAERSEGSLQLGPQRMAVQEPDRTW